jgi:hypothetical protein
MSQVLGMSAAIASSVRTFSSHCRRWPPSAGCAVSTLAALSLVTLQASLAARCARPCSAFELRWIGSRPTRIQEEPHGNQ